MSFHSNELFQPQEWKKYRKKIKPLKKAQNNTIEKCCRLGLIEPVHGHGRHTFSIFSVSITLYIVEELLNL